MYAARMREWAMTFIETIPPEDASGLLAEHYAFDRENLGGVTNFTQAFSLQPEVFAGWKQLNGAIKAGMDLRRYELATLAAARRLRSSYCMLAHGKVLADQFMDAGTVRAIAEDGDGTALDATDRAVMALAEKIVDDATAVTQADIDGLREHGLPDSEILGVILAASVRCFFSKTLDAAGVQADHRYLDLDPDFRRPLVVGRPIAPA
jgi:uncharacterized peroxidase-related enzyme